MAIFRPSARVALQLRIDEGADTALLDSTLEQEAPEAAAQTDPAFSLSAGVDGELAQVQAKIKALGALKGTLPTGEFNSLRNALQHKRNALQREKATGQAPQQPPDAIGGAPPDGGTVIGNILPRSVSIGRNGLNTADTCEIRLDYRDAPIDPRLIRSAGVDVIIGTVSAKDFLAGIRGERRADGSLKSLVAGAAPGETLTGAARFVGWVDEWSLEQSEDGDEIVLNCRDMTALLIDLPLPPEEGVDLTLPLDQAIQELLDRSPTTRGIKVFMGKPNQENPPEAPIPADAVPRARKARKGKVVKRARAGDQKMKVWDHLMDVCGMIGFVPLFIGFDLHIIEPRTFFVGGEETPARMLYGRNLKNLSFSRKLGGVKVPTVEIRSYDPAIGRTRWARFPVPGDGLRSGIFGQTDPQRAGRAAEVTPSGSADDRILNLTVDGVTDSGFLEQIAENTFEQVARQEVEGSFSTMDIDSFDNEGTADLLTLEAGDPVEVRTFGPPIEPPVTETNAQQLATQGPEQAQAYLEALGWRPDLAQAIARAGGLVGDLAVFRVSDANIDYDQDSGIAIEVTFINFIVVRLERPDTDADLLGSSRDQLGV